MTVELAEIAADASIPDQVVAEIVQLVQRQQARGDHHHTGQQGQNDQGPAAVIGGKGLERGPGGERGGGRGRDDHHLAAGRQTAADPARERGVQAEGRVHPG